MSRFRTARPGHASSFSPVVKSWLSQADGIETLWPSLERQSAIQADVAWFCEQQHCGLALVRELHTAELVMLARTSSQAAKLRNLQASLLHHLTQRGWHFTRIIVRVQPEQFPKPALHPSTDKKNLPENSLAGWQNLGNQLPPGELKNAVLYLLKRRGKVQCK